MNNLLRRNEENLLNDEDLCGIFTWPFSSNSFKNTMNTDMKKVENGYQLEIEIPGCEKENVKINFEKEYLNVKIEVKEATDNKTGYLRKERYTGNSSRSYYLGDQIDDENIKATMKNGILTIFVPFADPKTNSKKFIEIE